MKAKHRHYHSYLLRIWKENVDASWRASAQDIATGEFKYFASLVELHHFLEQSSSRGDGEALAVSGSVLANA